MIEFIINAIALAINKKFGDSYKIYKDEIKQGLQEPCFFICCLNPTNDLFRDRRYFRKNSFVIQYFPLDKLSPKAECNAVADALYLCLEWITVNGDLTMGTKMNYEIVDGILNFFINYDMFMIVENETVPMEILSIQTTEKEVKQNGNQKGIE